ISGRVTPTRANQLARRYNLTIAKSDILQVERSRADKRFAEVLRDAVETVEQAGLAFLVLGGLASALVGRPRWTPDIDLLLRPDEARDVLAALASVVLTTDVTDALLPYQAFKVLIIV